MQRNGTQRLAATRRFAQRTREAKCAEGRARTGAQRGARAACSRSLSARFLLEQMTSFPFFHCPLLHIIVKSGTYRKDPQERTVKTIPQQQ